MRVVKPSSFRAAKPVKHAVVRGQKRVYVSLAESPYATEQVGVSRLMVEYHAIYAPPFFSVNISSDNESENYVLAARSHGKRYKFWAGVGEVLDVPKYNGETLYADTVFELWSTTNSSSGTFDGFTFYLPVVRRFDGVAYTQGDIVLAPLIPLKAQLLVTPAHVPQVDPPHPSIYFNT